MNPLIILITPFCGAFISYFIGKRNEVHRDIFNIILNAAVLIGILLLSPSLVYGPVVRHMPHLMGTGLDIRIGPLQYLMLLTTAGIWFLTTMFLTQYVPTRKKRNRFHFFFLLTYGSTLGFFMTDNILNQFTFFEILSLSGYFLIIHDEDNAAHEAGMLYLTMAILGGLCALLGILIAYEATGSLMVSEIGRFLPAMGAEPMAAGGLLFFGYAVKAGIFPLHIWVPKAYAAAPTPAAAVLTGILAKTGLYGLYTTVILLTGSQPVFGWLAVALGFVTLLHGGVLALFQRNVKHILAYSSMSQYGLILLAIGVGALSGPEGMMAVGGAFIHMVSHSLFKVLLFLSIGLLYLKTQELNLNLIHGIGKKSGMLAACFSIAILSAWGMPGFTGSTSKSLIHEGLAHWSHTLPAWGETTAEGLFILGSALTVAYFLKLFTALFLDPVSEFADMLWLKRRKRASVPMLLLGVLILATGFFPTSLWEIVKSGLSAQGYGQAAGHGAAPMDLITLLLPVLLGLLIHLAVTRRWLRKAEGAVVEYINPGVSWFSLEAHLYIPVGRTLFLRATALVALMDSGLVRGAGLISRWFRAADALLMPAGGHPESNRPEEWDQAAPAPLMPPVQAPVGEVHSDAMTASAKAVFAGQNKHQSESPNPLTRKKTEPSLAKRIVPPALKPIRTLLESTSGLTFALYLFGGFLVTLIFVLLFR